MHGEMHSMSNKKLHQRTVFRLIVVASVVAVFLIYWLLVPAKHDPVWWEHAGIKDGKKGDILESRLRRTINRKTAQVETTGEPFELSGLKTGARRQEGDVPPITSPVNALSLSTHFNLSPKNGTEFIADYDVSKVMLDPEPPLSEKYPKYLFHYVDPRTSKWPMIYLSNKPRAAWIPNFLSHEECDALIAEASKTMARSQVVPYKAGGDHDTVSEVRTSTQTWLRTDIAPALDIIKRIYEFTGFPDGSGEMLQILRYEPGQKYNAHLDYFDPKLYGPQSSNRALTVYLYLSDVQDGGYTQFPRADGKPPTYDFTSCEAGLKVRPIKGTVAIFYDMKPNGEYDDYSLHGACKPIIGTKWGGTLWLRVPTEGLK